MAAEPWIDFGDTAYWDELIDKDISMAKTLIKVKKYFNSGVTCYKATAKILSRWFVSNNPPHELPAIDKLAKFAQAIGFDDFLSIPKTRFFLELDAFNSASNSVEQKARFSETLTEDYCKSLLSQTEDLYDIVKTTSGK